MKKYVPVAFQINYICRIHGSKIMNFTKILMEQANILKQNVLTKKNNKENRRILFYSFKNKSS